MDDLLSVDPRSALNAAIDGARLAQPLVQGLDGRQHALVPNGYTLKDISDPLRLPTRVRQSIEVDDRASMSAFLNRYKNENTIIVADFTRLTIVSVIDFHRHNQHADGVGPAACDFVAAFRLLPSEEFMRWDEMEGEMHLQDKFAEFLDENAVDICDPDSATMVEISRELEATIGASFKSKVSLESGDRAFVYETETKTKGDVVVPKSFALNIPLYNGEGPEILQARFRFKPTGDGLRLGFVWHRVEYQRRAFFNAIATAIADETGCPVFAGRADAPQGYPRS